MKLLHSTTTTLNTKEFNKLSDSIIDSLYELDSVIRYLYDIHVNYIDNSWAIDFVPLIDDIPVINIDTYTEYDDAGRELLKITPALLSDMPGRLKFKNDDESYDLCANYVAIFKFIRELYDFEYRLS